MGLPLEVPPSVRRVSTEVEPGRTISALAWGDSDPELVLLHGGAQNAHTWDSVAIALGRPLLAIDLPGHGHSDGGRDGSRAVDDLAGDVAIVMEALAPDSSALVGMSLGGLTSILVADRHPELVRRHVLVDITPGVTGDKSRAVTDFIGGPESFESFDEILAHHRVQPRPQRPIAAARRASQRRAARRRPLGVALGSVQD